MHEWFKRKKKPRDIRKIDSVITRTQGSLSGLPQSHSVHLPLLYNLDAAQLIQYTMSNRREDLDKAILHFTQSILLPPHFWLRHGPSTRVLQALSFLSYALVKRSVLSNQPEDAICAAKYLRYLRDQPHQAFGVSRPEVTELLVEALAFQVKSETGNAMQDIREISVLCHELLTSDKFQTDRSTTRTIIHFSKTVVSKFRAWDPDLPLDQVIECLQLARMRKPKLRVAHSVLALCLSSRYFMNLVNDDYETAASILDEITSSPGDSQDEYLDALQQLVAMMAVIRSQAHTTPEYSEEAIYRVRARLVDYPSDIFYNNSLESAAKQRLRYFGSIEGLEASSADRSWSLSQLGSQLGSISKDNNLEVRRNLMLLEGLFSGIPDDDITKMNEALEKGRATLASSPPRHMDSSPLFDSFACTLFKAFRRTNDIEYLNESISTFRQAFERPILLFRRFTTLRLLATTLLMRWEYFPSHRTQDMDEGLELYSQCVNDKYQSLADRFKVALLCIKV
jgi:hypothetical protein